MLENEHGIIKYIWSEKFSDNWMKDKIHFLKPSLISGSSKVKKYSLS